MPCKGIRDDQQIVELLLLCCSGAVPSPFDCYLVNRGLKTLAVRMRQHMASGLRIANYLEKHPNVQRVIYPPLESHPQHELYKQQMSGFSGMISMYLKGDDVETSRRFLKHLKVGHRLDRKERKCSVPI